MKGITLTVAQITPDNLNIQYGFKGHTELDTSNLPIIAQALIHKPFGFAKDSLVFGLSKLKNTIFPSKSPELIMHKPIGAEDYMNQTAFPLK